MSPANMQALLTSNEFRIELEEMSSYLASVKQERPIIYLLAKLLWRRGEYFLLESKKRDLWIREKRIEFKFFYDCDVTKLKWELDKYGERSLQDVWKATCESKKSVGWSVAMKLYEDIHERQPDLFVLVICSRDYLRISTDEQRSGLCWSAEQAKYNRVHGFNATEFFRPVVLRFLGGFNPVSITQEVVFTDGAVPSAYHFFLCELNKRPVE